MAKFGELLAELRADRKITQKQLADVLHVSVGTISNYENGVHFPDVEKLIDIADYFNITTDYLLGRTSNDFSLEMLDKPVVDRKTYGSMMSDLIAMSPERLKALALIIDDMKLGMLIEKCNKKKD